MLEMLLHWETLQKIVLNTLLVSIPEEFYLVMFVLILAGEFDYWEQDEYKKLFYKWDYVRVFVPTVVVALLSNIFRYLGFNLDYFSLIPILVLFVLIILTNDVFGDASAIKWIGKAFIFLILAIITILISELIYAPFILYASELSVNQLNNNIALNFCISIPSRIIQYSILVFLVLRKKTILKANVLKPIFESRVLTVITAVSIVLHGIFFYIMMKTVIYDKILINLSATMRLLVVLGICILPVLNMLLLIWVIYYIKNYEALRLKRINNNLGNIIESIKEYEFNEDYGNIKWKLNEINVKIEQVTQSLQK